MHAIGVLTILGLFLGFLLGLAAKRFKVESDPLVDKVGALLPGTNCGQCGFPGCPAAAEAIANGTAPITLCPPGGRQAAEELSALLNVPLQADGLEEGPAKLARIRPELCTGCVKCFKECPTDAVIGAPKQIHAVMYEACTGCGKCVDACPSACIEMFVPQGGVGEWRWPSPASAARGDELARAA